MTEEPSLSSEQGKWAIKVNMATAVYLHGNKNVNITFTEILFYKIQLIQNWEEATVPDMMNGLSAGSWLIYCLTF